MFFDRYEIHIQAFVHFLNGKLSFSDPHLRKIILKLYTQKLYLKNIFHWTPRAMRCCFMFYVHCVPQEGGRMQGWESKC